MLFKKLWLKKLRSRKFIPFPIPDDARELTEEEKLLVNDGSERRENSHEGSIDFTMSKSPTLDAERRGMVFS